MNGVITFEAALLAGEFTYALTRIVLVRIAFDKLEALIE